MDSEILLSVKDSVAHIGLNRAAKKNALNGDLLKKLLEALDEVERNSEIKVMVLASTTDAIFCSGADLSGIANVAQATSERKLYAEFLKRMRNLKKPSVAQVSGACMGGGLGLALSCDVLIASNTALFCTPEVHVGLYPFMISPLIYENFKSKKQADHFILTGKKVSAADAFELGFVTEVCSQEDLNKTVAQTCAGLARLDGAVVAQGKKAVLESKTLTYDKAVDHLGNSLDELFARPETQTKIQAFLKRG